MTALAPSLLPTPFEQVRALAAADMAGVDALIRARLHSDVALINQIAEHIIGGGGKRLRPMLHVLCARAAGYDGRQHLQLAAVIEFIHTATLLHDDVVDASELRRGRRTANALWGNAASVLVGDFLYSRAFQLMVELDRMTIMRILADTTNHAGRHRPVASRQIRPHVRTPHPRPPRPPLRARAHCGRGHPEGLGALAWQGPVHSRRWPRSGRNRFLGGRRLRVHEGRHVQH